MPAHPPRPPRQHSFRASSWMGLALLAALMLLPARPTYSQIQATACSTPAGNLVIDPAALPVGPYAAGTLSPHVTHPPGQILEHDNWTTGRTRFMAAANASDPVLLSQTCSRDQEVETWMRAGRIYLRLTSNGRGILFDLNQETPKGTLSIGLASRPAGSPDAAVIERRLYHNDDLAGTWTSYTRSDKAANDRQRFTFGVAGFDIYVRLNGVEVLRFQDIHHVAAGAIALRAPEGYGFRSTAIRHLTDKTLRSSPDHHVYDVRDFGVRELRAQGSLKAGGRRLALAMSADFKIGDFIIVETGKEAGRGLRGTVGVGGTWPQRSYPDLAAMENDHAAADGSYAWHADTGDVHRYEAASRTWVQDAHSKKYYPAKAVPRALQARIKAIADGGETLVLDRAADVDISEAQVHLDIAPIINQLVYPFRYQHGGVAGDLRDVVPSRMRIELPPGRFAVGSGLAVIDRRAVHLKGAGRAATTLFSPDGAPSASITVSGTANSVSDISVVGNARDHGFGLNWLSPLVPFGYGPDGLTDFRPLSPSAPVTETLVTQGSAYPTGISLSGSENEVRDVRVVDVFQGAVSASRCQHCWAHNVAAEMTQGLRTYVQQQFMWSDAQGGGCVDCSVVSTSLIPGFSAFKSRDIVFERPRAVNAGISLNRVGGFTIREAHIVIQAGSQSVDRSFSEYNPIINVNTNIDGAVSVEDGNGLIGITVNAENPNITIRGGFIQGPNWRAPGKLGTPVGVNSTGRNTIVDGLRVVGTTNPNVWPPGNIVVADGVVKNCVADHVHVGKNARAEGCVTNAEHAQPQRR